LWFEVEDLDATFNRFVAQGAKITYPPTKKPWGATLAAVFDPDGNVVGLTQRGAESAHA
jgi:predicted enzyme related to lactoylglutathione lyase